MNFKDVSILKAVVIVPDTNQYSWSVTLHSGRSVFAVKIAAFSTLSGYSIVSDTFFFLIQKTYMYETEPFHCH